MCVNPLLLGLSGVSVWNSKHAFWLEKAPFWFLCVYSATKAHAGNHYGLVHTLSL